MASLSHKQQRVAAALFARAMVEQGGLRDLEDLLHDGSQQRPAVTDVASAAHAPEGGTPSELFWASHPEELLLVLHVCQFLGLDACEAEVYLDIVIAEGNRAQQVDMLLQQLQAEESSRPATAMDCNEGLARAVQKAMEEDSREQADDMEARFALLRQRWHDAAPGWRRTKAKKAAIDANRLGPGPIVPQELTGDLGAKHEETAMRRSRSAFFGNADRTNVEPNPRSMSFPSDMPRAARLDPPSPPPFFAELYGQYPPGAAPQIEELSLDSRLDSRGEGAQIGAMSDAAPGRVLSQRGDGGAHAGDGGNQQVHGGSTVHGDRKELNSDSSAAGVAQGWGVDGAGCEGSFEFGGGFMSGGFMNSTEDHWSSRDAGWNAFPEEPGQSALELKGGSGVSYQGVGQQDQQGLKGVPQLPVLAHRGTRQGNDLYIARSQEQSLGTTNLRADSQERNPASEPDSEDDFAMAFEQLASRRRGTAEAGRSPGDPSGEVSQSREAEWAGGRRGSEDEEEEESVEESEVESKVAGSGERDLMQVFGAQSVSISAGTRAMVLWEILAAFVASSKQRILQSTAEYCPRYARLAQPGRLRQTDLQKPNVVGGEFFGRSYDARERTALRVVGAWLGADWPLVGAIERTVATVSVIEARKPGARDPASHARDVADATQKTRGSGWAGWGRTASIGAAAVGTGALLALTGGLAAPVVLGTLGYIGSAIPIASSVVAGAAAFGASSVGSAAIIGACGVAGAQLGGIKMQRRLGDVEDFMFVPVDPVLGSRPPKPTSSEPSSSLSPAASSSSPSPSSSSSVSSSWRSWRQGSVQTVPEESSTSGHKGSSSGGNEEDAPPKPARLAAAVCVAGFGVQAADLVDVWSAVPRDMERFALVYQCPDLIKLSKSIISWFSSEAMQNLMSNGGHFLLLKALGSSFMLPLTLISATSMIDSQWAVVTNRTDKAGVLLAEVLVKRVHGPRPVTLIGFSMGARAIFSCLCHLAATYPESEAKGLVEQVILLGAPIPAADKRWPKIRQMVSGRVVNGYTPTDWVLGLVCRTSFLLSGVAGIQPVQVAGIQNVNLTSIVDSHAEYGTSLDKILQAVQF